MASNRFNPPQAAGIHGFVAAHDYNAGEDWTWPQRPLNTYTALVDLMSNTYIADKTVIYMFDAFFSSQSQNQQMDLSSKWQAEPFNYDWPTSIFISQDPVAIDSVGIDFLVNEPAVLAQDNVITPNSTLQNYIHEAALADNPPSGTVYKNGAGKEVSSLGVHEHWNNATDRQYSRNLGKDEGIELIQVN
jgi:hypothetical protein